jgi:molybdopterin synthase catalytic subunit
MADADVSVLIVDRPVDLRDLAEVPRGSGGDSIFLGRTRPETHPEHGPLTALDYECHVRLAERVLGKIAADAAARHHCLALRIVHAVGPVPVGAASVLVHALAAHRAESFAACREGIDRLKREAPIWKRETWADGSTWADGVPVAPAAPPAVRPATPPAVPPESSS